MKMKNYRLCGLLAAMAALGLFAAVGADAISTEVDASAAAAQQYIAARGQLQAATDMAPDAVVARDSQVRGRVIEVAGTIVGRTTQASDPATPLSIVLRPDLTDCSVFIDSDRDHPAVQIGNSVHVLLELGPRAHPLDHYRLREIVLTADLPAEQRNTAATPPEQLDAAAREPANAIKTNPLAGQPPANPITQIDQAAAQPQIARPGSEFPGLEQWGGSEMVNTWMAWVLKQNSRLTELQARLIVECVIYYSQKFRIDHRLAFAMIKYESNFNPTCRSHAGAMGLTQLMPGTARYMGVSDPWDIRQNIMGGIRYLSEQLYKYEGRSNYEQTRLGLACYNAGPNAVKRAGGVPNYAETQRYVKRVTDLFLQLWESGMP